MIVFPLVSVSTVLVVETVMTAPAIPNGLMWLWLMTDQMFPVIGIEISGLVVLPWCCNSQSSWNAACTFEIGIEPGICCTGTPLWFVWKTPFRMLVPAVKRYDVKCSV